MLIYLLHKRGRGVKPRGGGNLQSGQGGGRRKEVSKGKARPSPAQLATGHRGPEPQAGAHQGLQLLESAPSCLNFFLVNLHLNLN